MSSILKIENLSKSFEGLKLFQEVNVSIAPATINSLFGGNGSGKSTFFNMLGGFVRPDEGRIYFNGAYIRFHNEAAIARAGIGKMWQDPLIFPNHTVLQNMLVCEKSHPGEYILNYIFKLRTIRKKEEEFDGKARQILRKFRIADKSNALAGSLSLGEKKLLNISMLLMSDAKLLLLDEPFSGISPNTIERMSTALMELKEKGKTIFMIEHKMQYAARISDHCFKVHNYKIESTLS